MAIHYGWVVVAACIMISSYYSGVILLGFTAAIDPLAREFGWSYAQISFATSLRGLESGLLIPVAGVLMNRWGPKILMASGAVIAGIGMISLSKANSLLAFYAYFIIMSSGLSTATSALLMATVTGWFKKNLGLATGIATCGVAVGGLFIPIVTHLIDRLGWRDALLTMGIGMWLIPFPLTFLLRRSPIVTGDRTENPASKAGISAPPKPKDMGAREAMKSFTFWVISLCFFCQVLPLSSVGTLIMPFLSSVGVDRITGSLIASSLPLMTVFGRIGFGWLGDRAGNKVMSTIALALTAFGTLLLAFISSSTIWLVFFFIPIFGIGWGGSIPMINGLLCDHFGSGNISSITGFNGSVLMAAMMIGAPFAGWIFDHFGTYRPAWFLMAAITTTAMIVFIRFVGKPAFAMPTSVL